MDAPWNRARKKKHELQEERNGKMEGGKRQPNSGRIWRWRRDNVLHDFLVESRTTDAGSYRIEGKEFQQIKNQAHGTPPGLLPAMQIDISRIDVGTLHLFVCELDVIQDMKLRLLELEALVGDDA